MVWRPQCQESMILGVGRFVPDKKADVLVEAFRACATAAWRAGGSCWPADWIPSGKGALPYVDGLKQRAEGYPIDLRMDVPGPELRKLFQTAAIFWHAKGYGVDPDVNPEHMEHFGIVVVEAMAAGCVPFIFAGGGQQEIVQAWDRRFPLGRPPGAGGSDMGAYPFDQRRRGEMSISTVHEPRRSASRPSSRDFAKRWPTFSLRAMPYARTADSAKSRR